MQIDSGFSQAQLAPLPVRPQPPANQGQEIARPVTSPNGAEAGARNPLQDSRRDSEARLDQRQTADPSRNNGQQDGLNRSSQRAGGEPELTEAEKREVEQLKARDREVRAHEQAHKSAAGRFARSGVNLEYEQGPDGNRYAVGGEVSIDASKVPGDPEATIAKAQTIRRAALAPAEPSAQDRAVAAQATQLEAEARQEIQEQRQAEAAEGVQAANDAFNPDSGNRVIPSPAPAPVGTYLDVFV